MGCDVGCTVHIILKDCTVFCRIKEFSLLPNNRVSQPNKLVPSSLFVYVRFMCLSEQGDADVPVCELEGEDDSPDHSYRLICVLMHQGLSLDCGGYENCVVGTKVFLFIQWGSH